MMKKNRGRFEVYRTDKEYDCGGYRWLFRAQNGRIIASGESYARKRDCLRAVEIMQTSGGCEVREA